MSESNMATGKNNQHNQSIAN